MKKSIPICHFFVGITLAIFPFCTNAAKVVAPMNGVVSFDGPDSARDALFVSTGQDPVIVPRNRARTIRATEIYMLEGHPDTELGLTGLSGQFEVHVADVEQRMADDGGRILYAVFGEIFNPGEGRVLRVPNRPEFTGAYDYNEDQLPRVVVQIRSGLGIGKNLVPLNDPPAFPWAPWESRCGGKAHLVLWVLNEGGEGTAVHEVALSQEGVGKVGFPDDTDKAHVLGRPSGHIRWPIEGATLGQLVVGSSAEGFEPGSVATEVVATWGQVLQGKFQDIERMLGNIESAVNDAQSTLAAYDVFQARFRMVHRAFQNANDQNAGLSAWSLASGGVEAITATAVEALGIHAGSKIVYNGNSVWVKNTLDASARAGVYAAVAQWALGSGLTIRRIARTAENLDYLGALMPQISGPSDVAETLIMSIFTDELIELEELYASYRCRVWNQADGDLEVRDSLNAAFDSLKEDIAGKLEALGASVAEMQEIMDDHTPLLDGLLLPPNP